jgi:hypothetical protein
MRVANHSAALCSPEARCMLRTLLFISFLVLAVIAPVWIPLPAVRALTSRPAATRLHKE